MKNLVILGSSGSIGKNALWVAQRFPEELKIFGLAVHSNTEVLAEQIAKYHPEIVCIADSRAADEFAPVADKLNVELLTGNDCLEKLASHSDADIVLNAVIGFAGLRSTLAAAKSSKRIALANKESMVAGGELVNAAVDSGHAELIPVDSEHSAIFQCLHSGNHQDIRRLILTSSGGPFRQYTKDKFQSITVEQALKHPTWIMGKKITIDSATLMNKGLEIIEAVYLFNLAPEKISVVIHPQSIIHSMVEFIDGSTIAQLSRPDMRLPIQYAFFYPERRPLDIADLKYEQNLHLEFEKPDEDKFPSLELARSALRKGQTAPAILNAANEIAVEAFLGGKISFPDIFACVDYSLNRTTVLPVDSVENVVNADNNAREVARKFLNSRK